MPDADGRLHSFEQLRRNGPLVLSFFRGGRSPFCTAELCALQAANDEFESVGATLAVVTPETRDFPRQLKRSLGLDLKVLSDIDYGVGVSYGVLFRVPDETKAHYSGLGLTSAPATGQTYVIDTGSRIRSAFVEPDFTIRKEPAQILTSLRRAASAFLLEGPAIQRQHLAIQTSTPGCAVSSRGRPTSPRSRAAVPTLLRRKGRRQAASDSSIASSAGAALEDGGALRPGTVF